MAMATRHRPAVGRRAPCVAPPALYSGGPAVYTHLRLAAPPRSIPPRLSTARGRGEPNGQEKCPLTRSLQSSTRHMLTLTRTCFTALVASPDSGHSAGQPAAARARAALVGRQQASGAIGLPREARPNLDQQASAWGSTQLPAGSHSDPRIVLRPGYSPPRGTALNPGPPRDGLRSRPVVVLRRK
jgi:hypothetical protein